MEIKKRICDKCKKELKDCEPYYDLRIDEITYVQNGAFMSAMRDRIAYGDYCTECFKDLLEKE